jgi:hypothetical protein
MARYPADEFGGTCSGVIDLANGPGEPAYVVPLEITGPLYVGHTWDLDDPAAPIFTDPRATIEPGGAALADLRCPRCTATVVFDVGAGDTIAAVEHEPGCLFLAELLALAGVATS